MSRLKASTALTRTRKPGGDARGAAMVEASLIALPLLTILYGSMEFAIAFSVGSSVYDAAAPVANAARSGVGTATIESLETAAKRRVMPFARDCVDIDGWEYDTLDDYGADSSFPDDAFVISSETYVLGDSDRELGIFDITCEWGYLGNLLQPLVGDSVTFKTTIVVGYELE
ncbi:MAG: hypothetical protein Alpg2KO_16790 [Alphaproteobacteria bacterium]